ncbi:MAG: thioredoxin fold domain-containing protein [Candidatus Thiodiazotropha sp. (ex Monitilora ramsayi)]|nr:thioredoxin fold domain-containing protein [Candidatus Thiodiazotropha sp. (ex Monitilora ramsayi)]
MLKQSLIFVVLTLFSLSTPAEPPASAIDWSSVAQIARQHQSPILVVFSADTCSYCVRLKQEIIDPLSQDTSGDQNILIREFDINAGGKIIDFDGDAIRSRQFKRRYGIYATPTLLILDADGRLLSEPIVGYNSAPEYRELLNASLVSSLEALE